MIVEYLTLRAGEERTLRFIVRDLEKKPVSLSTLTANSFRFKNADGTVLVKSGTVIEAGAGVIDVTLSEAETALLKIGARQDVSADLSFGTVLRKVNIKRVLTVESLSV